MCHYNVLLTYSTVKAAKSCLNVKLM